MKIISWNVNGIRAVAKKGFKDFVKSENPDILAIQETKAFEDQFLKEVGELDGYDYIWHSGEKPGYAGTAIFYKKNLLPISSKNNFGEIEHFHDHGRITEVDFGDFILINGYYPNGGQKVTQANMLDYKLEFYDHIISYSNKLIKAGRNVILTGDFNVCHKEADIARPKENKNSIGFLPVERDKVSELLNTGFIDTFRHFYPKQTDTYSWWSYRAGARPRNIGWRLDYFVVNEDFIERVKDMKYLTDVMGSDHCPILLELQ